MELIFPNKGLVYCLQRLAGNTPDDGDGLTWHVYTSNTTPSRASLLTDFTLDDADFPPVTHDSVDLAITGISSDIAQISTSPDAIINGNVGSVSVYGYVITSADGVTIVAAARDDDAPVVVATGDAYTILPILFSSSLLP